MSKPKKQSTILTSTKEELAAIEKERKATVRKDNKALLNAVKTSLEEVHKYNCIKSKASLQKDYKLPDLPSDEHLVSKRVDGIWTNEKDGRTQEQKDAHAEYNRIDEEYFEAWNEHLDEASHYTAADILDLIDNQKCEKCGEVHAEPTNWSRDHVLMELLRGAAARLIKSDEYGYSGKADALERVIAMATDAYIGSEGNTEVVNDSAFNNIINSVALALPNHTKAANVPCLVPTNLGGSA